jgi:hypothetical protein
MDARRIAENIAQAGDCCTERLSEPQAAKWGLHPRIYLHHHCYADEITVQWNRTTTDEAQLRWTIVKNTHVYMFLAIMMASVTFANSSNATNIQYTLNAADGSGDTFGGTFDFDTITFADTNIALTASGPNTFNETLPTLVFASPLGTVLVASNTVDGTSITLNFATSLATLPPDLGLLLPLFNSDYVSAQHILTGVVIGTTVTATPLPATLPLFATGFGAMGLLGWRKKRKNAAAIAA